MIQFGEMIPREIMDSLNAGYEKLNQFLLVQNWLLLVLFGATLVFLMGWLIWSLINKWKRGWEVLYYGCLIGATILWAGAAFVSDLLRAQGVNKEILYIIGSIGRVFVPGLLCLHIWRQISYKLITVKTIIAALFVPLGLSAYQIVAIVSKEPLPTFQLWWYLPYYLYGIIAIIKSYLLCFGIFYQMPQHMRRSGKFQIIAVSIVLFSIILGLWESRFNSDLLSILVTCTAFYFLHEAFYAASSSNVIATSREFLYTSLSTMVVILSQGGRILDWNKRTKEALQHLPMPVYREPFEDYKKRVLLEGNGRVSPHGDNILLLEHDGEEKQYIFVTDTVRNEKREFGSVVEIMEISSVYTVLRYMEEIATRDQLTQLYNRNAYLEAVKQYVQQEFCPLLIIVGDVNNLKTVNDIIGHLVGDRLITTVASFITEYLPSGGSAYRIGGDEFVILVPSGNEVIASQFINALKYRCSVYQDLEFGVPTVSWGYAIRTQADEDYNEVFYRADQMMYAEKQKHHQHMSSGLIPLPDA